MHISPPNERARNVAFRARGVSGFVTLVIRRGEVWLQRVVVACCGVVALAESSAPEGLRAALLGGTPWEVAWVYS